MPNAEAPTRALGQPSRIRRGRWTLAFAAAVVSAAPALAVEPDPLEAARALLATLNSSQREILQAPFGSPAREDWNFVPLQERRGLRIGELSSSQRYLAHALLASSLSRSGYVKTATIMSLESLLRERDFAAGREGTEWRRDPDAYTLSFFGEPHEQEPWSWSFEGHHVSWNFTMVDGEVVAASPAFLGSNPHEVERGPRSGLRVLAAEEDRALELLRSLDTEQRKKAIVAPKAGMVVADVEALPRDTRMGLSRGSMRKAQKALLDRLIAVYVDNVAAEAAAERRKQVREAGDDVHFAWVGSADGSGRQYYRIQAATFLIEYLNVQNDANHVHSVWRDFDGDFGRDVLKEHLRKHPH